MALSVEFCPRCGSPVKTDERVDEGTAFACLDIDCDFSLELSKS